MWTKLNVRWEFITRLCANVPGTSDLIGPWLAARKPTTRPPQGKSLDEVAQEVAETILNPQEEAGPVGLVFQRVDGVLAVRMATIKAHLKDCAYQVQTYVGGYIEGEKSLRVKVANGIYWPTTPPVMMFQGTPFVPVLRMSGTPFTEASGIHEKPVHMQTPQGPRSALKAFEYVENAALEFQLLLLTAPPRTVRQKVDGKMAPKEVPGRLVVDEDDIKQVMLYGGVHGYLGERSEEGGRYAFTITRQEG